MRSRSSASQVAAFFAAVVALLGALRYEPAHTAESAGGVAAYHQGDYAKALPALKEQAARGDAVAEFYLGLMHADGVGVPIDPGEAFRHLACAAARIGDAALKAKAAARLDRLVAAYGAQLAGRSACGVTAGPQVGSRGFGNSGGFAFPQRATPASLVFWWPGEILIEGVAALADSLRLRAIRIWLGDLIGLFGDGFVFLVAVFAWVLAIRLALALASALAALPSRGPARLPSSRSGDTPERASRRWRWGRGRPRPFD